MILHLSWISYLVALTWSLKIPVTVVTNGFAFKQNDLISTLNASADIEFTLSTSITQAVSSAPSNSLLVYIVSSDAQVNKYPDVFNPFSLEDYMTIVSKNINAYIEYPSCVAFASLKKCLRVTGVKQANYERAVVVADAFKGVKNLSIIESQMTSYGIAENLTEQIMAAQCELRTVMSKVAGYDYAIFGLKDTPFVPLLFECQPSSSHSTIWYSMNGFSQFVSARYHPLIFVKSIIQHILETMTQLDLAPVRVPVPRLQPEGTIPNNKITLQVTFDRALNWIYSSKLLANEHIQCQTNPCFGPTPAVTTPSGNGTFGLLEGFGSGINVTGGQMQSYVMRMDCHGEVSGGLSFALEKSKKHGTVVRNLLTVMINEGQVRSNLSIEKDSAHGILLWGTNTPDYNTTMYCDDNARAIVGAMVATQNLYLDHPADPSSLKDFVSLIVEAILANFRLTSRNGYCVQAEQIATIRSKGWRNWFDSDVTNYVPHYAAWIWTPFLYACHVTNFQEMCHRTETGLNLMMKALYSGGVTDQNPPPIEYARIILELALLLRVDALNPTEDARKLHTKWLYDMSEQLIALQNVTGSIGTIRATFGKHATGTNGPPTSNAAYGTLESTLNQENTDPVSDQLYVTSFAMLSLHEAYMVTGDEWFKVHRDLLGHFFGVSQVHANSEELSYLAGTWFRAFDYNWLEYFASGADIGWGPTSEESGWTHGEVMTSIGLALRNQSLWNLSTEFENTFRSVFTALLPKFGFNATTSSIPVM